MSDGTAFSAKCRDCPPRGRRDPVGYPLESEVSAFGRTGEEPVASQGVEVEGHGTALALAPLPSVRHRPAYRAEIDGLRAVAVASVVLFHAAPAVVSGGFVGVDVFFVISGFLITTVLIESLHDGRLSFAAFYERRMRRLAPALVLVAVATTAASLWLTPPGQLRLFGGDLAAAAVSGANILFFERYNYFDQTGSSALLHTWSLSVEEQFYLAYPIVLWLATRRGGRFLLPALAVLTAASLIHSALLVDASPAAAFYLAPGRAWELLTGALLAAGAVPALRNPLAAEVTAATGFVLIGAAVIGYTSATAFPGPAAVVPCLGAALVILGCGERRTVTGRLLSLSPVVWLGLVSYPLYLWHWPILLMLRDQFGDALRLRHLAAGLSLSLALSAATWWFLERPIRTRRWLPGRSSVFAAGGAGVAAMVAAGAVLALSDGWPERYPPEARTAVGFLDYDPAPAFRAGRCFLWQDGQTFDAAACLAPDPDRPNVLLIGDSHAAHLWAGLAAAYPEVNILQATASGCRFVIGGGARGNAFCPALLARVLDDFLPGARIDAVVLAASWWNDARDVAYIPATVDALRRFVPEVWVVGPIVQYDRPLPRLLADDIRFHRRSVAERRIGGVRSLDREMAALAAETNSFSYVSLMETLCASGECRVWAEPGVPMQFDAGHLTEQGSSVLARCLRESGRLALPGAARSRGGADQGAQCPAHAPQQKP